MNANVKNNQSTLGEDDGTLEQRKKGPALPQFDERRSLMEMLSIGRGRKKHNVANSSDSQGTQSSDVYTATSEATPEAPPTEDAAIIEETSDSSSSPWLTTNGFDRENIAHALYNGQVNGAGDAEGQGQLTWTNGDRYIGAFIAGKQHGYGVLYFHNGAEYAGNWESGKMHGKGTHRMQNGDVFTGTFTNGERCGQGSMTFANGDKYVGTWRDGFMDGLGRYYYTNGQCFEGTFLNGKRHGQGKHQFVDGSVLVNKYVHNERVGEGVLWSADRSRVWRMVGTTRKGRIRRQQANLIMLRCEEM